MQAGFFSLQIHTGFFADRESSLGSFPLPPKKNHQNLRMKQEEHSQWTVLVGWRIGSEG